MGKRIVIAGAGGFGRGVYGWITSSPQHLMTHNITDIVFIDDATQTKPLPAALIGPIQSYEPAARDSVICAMGIPAVRRKVVQDLLEVGANFHTYIDDRAILGSGVTVEDGAVICPGVVMSADVAVGKQVHVNFNCSIGHDTVLGDFTTLSPSVNIMGQVTVGTAVFLGGSAVILPRLTIGDDVMIGAGAVVTRAASSLVPLVGNPAVALEPRRS